MDRENDKWPLLGNYGNVKRNELLYFPLPLQLSDQMENRTYSSNFLIKEMEEKEQRSRKEWARDLRRLLFEMQQNSFLTQSHLGNKDCKEPNYSLLLPD